MKMSGRKVVVFVVLAAAVALAYQLPYLRYNFYQQMMDGLALTDLQIGLIGSTVSLVSTLCYPIGGVIADKFSCKSLIVLTFGSFTVLSIWFAFAQGFVQLVIIHALFAFFGIATLWSAYLTAVRGLADEKSQSKIFGWNEGTRGIIQFVTSLAIVALMGVALNVAAASGGYADATALQTAAASGTDAVALADFSAGSAAGFRYVMLFAAALCAIFMVLAIIFMDSNKKENKVADTDAQNQPAVEEKKYGVVDVIKNPGVWIVMLLIMFSYMFWTIGNSYLTQYTTDVLGLDSGTASTIGTVRTYLIVAVAGFLGGIVLDKFPYKGRSFVVLLAVDTILVIVVMLTGSQLAICVAITIAISFISNIMKTTYWSTMGEAGIPAAMTPLATGVISFIAFIPDWIYPTVFGGMLDSARAADGGAAGAAVQGTYMTIFIILIICGIIGMIVAFMLWKRTKKLEAEGLL